MQKEIIYTREDGTRVRVEANLSISSYGTNPVNWSIRVETCPPKKRTWTNVHSTDDYTWRALGPKERADYITQKQLAVCTPDEILAVMTKVWESLKPE